MEETKTEEKKPNLRLILAGGVILVILFAILTNGFSFSGGVVNDGVILAIGDSPVLGEMNTPLTIYEFSDFSCPFCSVAALEEPVPQIIKEYVNTGKAKIVWKYFPGHGTGESAQLVGYCLNEQGLFWEFHDKAFENQKDVGDLAKMRELAKEIGADITKLNSCLKSGKYNSLLQEDTKMGESNGITGTPSFIINDKIVTGAKSFSDIKKIIDEELSSPP